MPIDNPYIIFGINLLLFILSVGQWPTTVPAIYRRLIQAVYFRDGIQYHL